MTALILSGSYLESNRYLQSEGKRGRHATNAEIVAGTYFTEIIQLPSFANRPDRHAVLSAVNRKTRGRNMPWETLDEWSPPPKPTLGDPGYKADMLFGDVPEVSDPDTSDAAVTVAPRPKAPSKRAAKNKTSSIDDLFGDD